MTTMKELPPPSSSLSCPPPESFFVFVVGHCEEWPDGREEQGDAAIYNEYLDFGVPEDQCMYIKNNDCTRKNCQEQLEIFLRRIKSSSPQQPTMDDGDPIEQSEEKKIPDTFVFYYGGHGSANGFSTIGGTWMYERVAQTVDGLFHGDRVLYMLDCCASGNLCQYLPPAYSSMNISNKKQYTLFATSHPYITTSAMGDEWILTNTWIQLMRRRRAADTETNDDLEMEKIISLMADRHVFELGDQFFAYVTTPSPSTTYTRGARDSWSWMPARCNMRQKINEETSSSLPSPPAWLPPTKFSPSIDDLYQMPREAKILSIRDCHVGDAIAYKHLGGYPIPPIGSKSTSSPSYVPPLWLNGTIVSIFEKDRDQMEAEAKDGHYDPSNIFLRLRVWYPSQTEPWEVQISHRSPRLINYFFVAQTWMLPRAFCKTQVMLARKYQQYLDCSVAADTPVKVALGHLGNDDGNETLEGTILDWKGFNWKNLLHSSSGKFPGTTRYDEYYWDELPVPVKAAASSLGYTKSSWDEDTGIPADGMEWQELTEEKKEAATVLGYVRKLSVSAPSGANGSDHMGLEVGTTSFWKNVSEISQCPGAHVPVKFNDNHPSSFVPLKQIIFSNTGETNGSQRMARSTLSLATKNEVADGAEHIHRECLLRGLESSGKSIGDAEALFGTTKLSAYWPDEEKWYDAAPIDIACKDESGNRSELTLKLLVTHYDYTLPGVYCPILYSDGERHLIPLNHVFRRGCQPLRKEGNSDDGSVTDVSPSITPVSTDEAIDDMTKSVLEGSSKASSFREQFSEVACKLEEASNLIRSALELHNDDNSKTEQHEATSAKSSSTTNAAPTSNSTIERSLHQVCAKSYLDEYWSDLPKDIKIVAKRIGYNKNLWDSDGRTPMESKEWQDLTPNERKDVGIIGYTETKWKNDCNCSECSSSESESGSESGSESSSDDEDY